MRVRGCAASAIMLSAWLLPGMALADSASFPPALVGRWETSEALCAQMPDQAEAIEGSRLTISNSPASMVITSYESGEGVVCKPDMIRKGKDGLQAIGQCAVEEFESERVQYGVRMDASGTTVDVLYPPPGSYVETFHACPVTSAAVTKAEAAYVCPEALDTKEAREAEVRRFLEDIRDNHPDLNTVELVMKRRVAFLWDHDCRETLRNLGTEKP